MNALELEVWMFAAQPPVFHYYFYFMRSGLWVAQQPTQDEKPKDRTEPNRSKPIRKLVFDLLWFDFGNDKCIWD